MKLIGIEKYRIYYEYNGDYCQLIDFRTGSKQDMSKITHEEWEIIAKIEDNLCALRTGVYSIDMTSQMKSTIAELRPLVSPEVFKLIESREKPERLKPAPWLSRVFAKK